MLARNASQTLVGGDEVAPVRAARMLSFRCQEVGDERGRERRRRRRSDGNARCSHAKNIRAAPTAAAGVLAVSSCT